MHRTHREELPACVGSGQSVWWLRTDGGAAGVFAAVDSRRCIDGGQWAGQLSAEGGVQPADSGKQFRFRKYQYVSCSSLIPDSGV